MSLFATPTPYLIAIIFAQWVLVSYLLVNNSIFNDRLSVGAKAEDTDIGASAASSSPHEKLPALTRNDFLERAAHRHAVSSDPPHGVFVTIVFKAPKWFHLRYVSMLRNALSNLPEGWKLQIFLNQPWVEENLPSYHPGWKRVLSDPRVSTTNLPDHLLNKKPKYTYQDPWFWQSMKSDRLFFFSGNGAFCGNTRYDYNWLEGLDYVGSPSYAHYGVGGDGGSHSYRNRTSMLAVLEYAAKNNLNMDDSTEYEFFMSTMMKMNKAESRFRLASREETFKFGGVVNLTDETSLLHLPLVVSGTLAQLSYEERDTVLKHCPEIKLIFPSLHEPACFGAHPNPERCRQSICALQENVPSHGC